jgi:hypothetical protein
MQKTISFGRPGAGRLAGVALVASAWLAACQGVLVDGAGSEGGVERREPLEGPSAGLRRLTVSEYRATVRDLLGVEAPASDQLQADTPVAGFASIGATRVAYSAPQVERFEQAAYDVAQQVFEEETRRAELVGCEPAAPEDACVREFLTRFTRRAFRRPATAEEVDVYASLVARTAADSDVWTGLAYAVAAILQSPYVLYRVELGDEAEHGDEAELGGADTGSEEARTLTAFEVATRLSYLVTGSTPDEALLDAAESGVLDTDAGLLEQLERLLASPHVEGALLRFLEEQLELDHVSKVNKLPAAFPEFSPALADAMKHEMYEVVREVALGRPDDLLTLLTRRETVVNGPLAQLYGLPAPPSPDDWVSVTLPEDGPRAGLLGFAGFLASHAGPSETSVTKRGFFVVSKLLCREIPAPPPGVVTVLPEPPEGEHVTMRERVEQHMSDPACRSCHLLMDPPGLALEHFDALGTYRETDNGLTIDASGAIDEQAFDGARELGELLASHPEVSACFARRFYEFALGTQLHRGAPVPDLVEAFEGSGRRLPELVRALVTHEVFRLASTPR